MGLLSCVGVGGVGENVASGGVISGKSLSASCALSLFASFSAVDWVVGYDVKRVEVVVV